MVSLDFKTRRVCSISIHVDLTDDGSTIENVEFTGIGCSGNLKAISKLVAGKRVEEIVPAIAGNTCGPRGTSCADQLAKALLAAQALAEA